MALSFARVEDADSVFGNKRIKVRDVTFDATYPAGGEPLVPSDVDLDKIDQVVGGVAVNSAGTAAIAVAYDHTNETLQAFEGPDLVGAFPEDSGDLSAFTARLTFIGH